MKVKNNLSGKKIKQHLAFQKPGRKQNLCHGSDFFKNVVFFEN